MDESELTALLRMSREADELERDLAAPVSRHGARAHERPATRHRVGSKRIVFAVAAIAALAAATSVLWVRGAGPVNGRGLAGAPGAGTAREDEGRENMLIALYRGEDGLEAACPECWCVQRWEPRWEADVRRVAESDLLGESIGRSCVTDPSRIVVIGLSGPAGSLPKSDDQAREIAMCLLECAPNVIGAEPALSPGCIASTVEYRIQTWNR